MEKYAAAAGFRIHWWWRKNSFIGFGTNWDLHRERASGNSLYTAITRAKKRLILVGDVNELREGAGRAGVLRKTRLLQRLLKYCKT